jgi:hypothetical protein
VLAVTSAVIPQSRELPALVTPEIQSLQAVAYLNRLSLADRPYIRFLSWLGTPVNRLARDQQTLSFVLPQLSREPDVEFAKEVPGSDGLLWALDLRDWGWNNEAWRNVALREPYFREPWISQGTAETLRRLIYTSQDRKTFHVEAIVRADWFFRETAETDRSTSYYDLLYARERFGDREYYHGDAQYKAQWYYKGANQGGFVDANFPKNKADFEKAFGADETIKLIQKLRLSVKNGALVEDGISIVARQNRILVRVPIPTGAYWFTLDVLQTAGKKDFTETAPFLDQQEFDAGEAIINLPNGGQAYLLFNGEGKRIEFADNKAAIDTSDPHDRRVRTPGSCVVCHGVGINKPENLMEQFLKDGLDIRFKEARKAREVRAFFLNWDKKLKGDQELYGDYVKRTAGRKGEENAALYKSMRDHYDAPVDFRQACLETGLTEEQFRYLGQKSPHARLLMLVRGRTIPRSSWEQDTYRETMLFTVSRKVPYVANH